MGQDKGHQAEMVGFVDNIKNSKSSMISFDSLVNTTLTTFAHVKSLEENREVHISELENELNELIAKIQFYFSIPQAYGLGLDIFSYKVSFYAIELSF